VYHRVSPLFRAWSVACGFTLRVSEQIRTPAATQTPPVKATPNSSIDKVINVHRSVRG
jgi:hypothetical protein